MITMYVENEKGEHFKIVLYEENPSLVDKIFDQLKGVWFIKEEDFYLPDPMTVNIVENGKIVGDLITRKLNLEI